MTTPVEKRNAGKFCEFYGEVGHTTDECMHLKKQIEEMLKAEKLSYLIKELKQNSGKDQAKPAKKREAQAKDKALAILMVQPWQRAVKQRITQTFSPEPIVSFPPLEEEDGTKGPMIIEAEMEGHCVHRMYVDGGSSSEVLYEHCFSRFRKEIKDQMVPATTPLVGFSGEIIWPLGQISLLVKIGDDEHSTSAWMNFMIVRSPSPYNGIIGRPGDTVTPTNNGGTKDIHPPVVQISKPVDDLVNAPMPNQKVSIPFPSRRNDERRREKDNDQIEKFYKIFRDMSFKISFTDALTLMPKFASTLKALIGNKEKLSEVARTPLNENCSALILNKLPKKLGDPGRFLIPCEFSGIDTYNALADLGASINLMPYSVWSDLSLPTLTPTCMMLELADHSITKPIGIAKDVHVMVGKFQFLADFVVVEFKPDPRVPLILRRSFLKTSRALIDVYEGEITLRVGKEAITFNLDQTSRYTANYNHMTANRIDVIDMACEEYSQEVLGFFNVIASGNPTPYYDLIVATSSPTLTPFGDSDFLLFKEADSFLGLEDDPDSPAYSPFYYDLEGDILLLEAILNSEPPPPLPNQADYLPEIQKELKICEAKTVKSSIDEPPEVELKELPPHLE
ncbi:reverse transcriptase domain-containing protein [Tanacetum coccineum]